MGRFSYVLVGTEQSIKETFGSTCHGAGRVKSRTAARRELRGEQVLKNLESKGITVRAGNMKGLAEEAPQAYKNVESVVTVAHNTGISKIIARTKPIGVIKG
jgi:tRNA-splicing ligase RtcB